MNIDFLWGKIFASMLAPTSVLFVWTGLAAIFCDGKYRLIGLAVPFGLMLIISFGPVSDLMISPLEQRFKTPSESQLSKKNIDGIVILGGGLDPERTALNRQYEFTEAADRIMTTVTLAVRFPVAKIIVTGGSGDVLRQQYREADYVAAMLRQWGVASDRLVIDNQSRTTAEHPAAIASQKPLPQPGKSYLLVTSAAHMPRAVGVFRRAGWRVIAWPVDYRALPGWHFTIGDGLGRGWARCDAAAREWLGLLAYSIQDKTSEFFPGVENETAN
jgi:uncharacterized SAM-binding protein YcdF (DUF218 family)